jgi:hypothetical protein
MKGDIMVAGYDLCPFNGPFEVARIDSPYVGPMQTPSEVFHLDDPNFGHFYIHVPIDRRLAVALHLSMSD